jgi:uncharacterized lipoprotein YmbA
MSRLSREMRWPLWQILAFGTMITTLVSCAAPQMTLYRLGMPALSEQSAPLAPVPVVIAIGRISVPDYLDTEDILVRHGSVVQRSDTGRWASRLSLGATALITERLAQSRPDALVTDDPQTTTATDRVIVDVSRLDLSMDRNAPGGAATLEADWIIVPVDPTARTRRDRTQITVDGPVDNDAAVVALTTAALTRLAAAIDITRLR